MSDHYCIFCSKQIQNWHCLRQYPKQSPKKLSRRQPFMVWPARLLVLLLLLMLWMKRDFHRSQLVEGVVWPARLPVLLLVLWIKRLFHRSQLLVSFLVVEGELPGRQSHVQLLQCLLVAVSNQRWSHFCLQTEKEVILIIPSQLHIHPYILRKHTKYN